jgi:hypothetical protein
MFYKFNEMIAESRSLFSRPNDGVVVNPMRYADPGIPTSDHDVEQGTNTLHHTSAEHDSEELQQVQYHQDSFHQEEEGSSHGSSSSSSDSTS